MSDINVHSSTQKIFVDPASSSVAVINAGPPGPPSGTAGPPGQVQQVMAGDGIAVDSNAPAYPIVSALKQIRSGNYRTTVMGNWPVGPYVWPGPQHDVGGYAGSVSFYSTADGAKYPGIYSVSSLFRADVSDQLDISMCFTFDGIPKVTSACFAWAAFGGYVEHYLAVGKHITWALYKPTGMGYFATSDLAMALSYRPVTE
jgi:hypothetical protein